eukprot:CAMPEP_0117522300 /NCGR_PEP_ID=MMETSP0784-20121206/34135_1 /TAXON_ID=39447 /ORGANISM="" /LENGTH=304 /DNA_ID=CAMNT_0005318365 /DNA_START=88 /DNA_END=998 /DNA_ORIENTATION=-
MFEDLPHMCSRDPGLWTLILSARGPAHPNSKVSFWIGADGSTPDWHSYRSPRQHLHYGVPLLLFAGSGARTRRAASFLASTPDAGAAHGGVDRCLVGAWPENLRARRTSFVDSARPEVAIKKVNDEALKSLKVIEEHAGPVDKYRQKLDEAMDSFTNATRSWCDYYMIHRQQIEAIAGRLCAAAQGRLNSSSLGDEKGPMYCYSEPADPAFPTQEVLQAAAMQSDFRPLNAPMRQAVEGAREWRSAAGRACAYEVYGHLDFRVVPSFHSSAGVQHLETKGCGQVLSRGSRTSDHEMARGRARYV